MFENVEQSAVPKIENYNRRNCYGTEKTVP